MIVAQAVVVLLGGFEISDVAIKSTVDRKVISCLITKLRVVEADSLDALDTVVVASSLTLAVSSLATGASFTAVTLTVIVLGVALSASPSFTVNLIVV